MTKKAATPAVPEAGIKQMAWMFADRHVIVTAIIVIALGLPVVIGLIPEIKEFVAYHFHLPVSQEYKKNQLVMQKLDKIIAYEASKDSATAVAAELAPYKNLVDSIALDRHIAEVCQKCQRKSLGASWPVLDYYTGISLAYGGI